MMQQPNLTEQNKAVKNWFTGFYQKVKASYMSKVHDPDRSGDGLDSLQLRFRENFGEVVAGGIKFNRYLIWMHKGAGRGFGGRVGSKWIGPDGQLKSTNQLSLGKMNTGKRREEPWFNPVLDQELPALADTVAGFKADAAIKAIQVK